MITLLEEPLPIIFVGIVIEAILAGLFVATRRIALLLLMLATLLVVLALLVVEHLVVTEREQVEATVFGIAEALEANDWDRVKSYCTPDARRTRARIDEAQQLVEILDTGIHNLQISISHVTSPPLAEARFQGVVTYRRRDPFVGYGRYSARFRVQFRRTGQRWLVTDHIEHQPVSR
ncbi:MAG TPA: hypothetical protein EYP56_23145 [Planctomycetaceae bacterium]|nr:hypothetical protein [Planctomycetaceae bacterium]HIQ20697.1 hypothetical protein [Planctomycetota bacterium]